MDNVSSPASSPLGRVRLEQMVLESPSTIMEFPSFAARIDAAAIAFYGALEFAPVTNLLMFTDACVERLENRYRQDISDEPLFLLVSSVFKLLEIPSSTSTSSLKDHKSTASSEQLSQTNQFLRYQASSDPRKPKFTLLDPSSLR